MPPTNLDSFVTSSSTPPTILATSTSIQDRDSTFTASIYSLSSPSSFKRIHANHRNVINSSHPASHEIAAWRCMALKAGRNGLGGPDDFEVMSGKEDDGEDHGGRCVLKVMEREGVIDAVVIVSRWFGGTLLGPVRFTHIETCTREVCRAFKAIEEIETIIEELKELDEQLSQLRAELSVIQSQSNTETNTTRDSNTDPPESATSASTLSGSSNPSPARRVTPDYAAMLLSPAPDLGRAKRLLTARQHAIRSVRGVLERARAGLLM